MAVPYEKGKKNTQPTNNNKKWTQVTQLQRLDNFKEN